MSLVERLDRYQRQHRWLSVPIATGYKFFEDAGMHVVASMTYYAFAAGMLLLSGNLLSRLNHTWPGLVDLVAQTPLGEMPLIGHRLRGPGRGGLHGGPLGWLVGLLGAVYGGVGVAVAFQHGMNTVWQIPRNSRPNPLAGRLRGLVLFVILVVSVLLSTVLGWVGRTYLSRLGLVGNVLGFALSTLVNGVVFWLGMRLAVAQRRPWRWLVPGAVVAAAAWQLCQIAVMTYLSRLGGRSLDLRLVVSVVLSVLGALWATMLAVVLAAELNVVLHNRLYPRALLTAFTDRVELTPADISVYTAHARMQRFKGQERIEVSFADPPPRRRRRGSALLGRLGGSQGPSAERDQGDQPGR